MIDSTSLYRHWDADGHLLYVGVSLNAVYRLSQHRRDAAWYQEIKSVSIERFPTREAALSAERAAIIAEKPRHNVMHNSVKAVSLRPSPRPQSAATLPQKKRSWYMVALDALYASCGDGGVAFDDLVYAIHGAFRGAALDWPNAEDVVYALLDGQAAYYDGGYVRVVP